MYDIILCNNRENLKLGAVTMVFEKSCGVVIYRKNKNNLEFLTISHRYDGHWGFPKGHVEKNESEEETAIREVCEETGLKVTLINGFRAKIQYSPKNGITKEVIYFLAKVYDDDVYIQLEEIKDYRWSRLVATKEILSYKSSVKVLEKAYAFISSRHNS
ncbi:MAG: NUDIX domain-containing protein [Clostridium sp.]